MDRKKVRKDYKRKVWERLREARITIEEEESVIKIINGVQSWSNGCVQSSEGLDEGKCMVDRWDKGAYREDVEIIWENVV